MEQQNNISLLNDSLLESCRGLQVRYQQLKDTLERCTSLSSKLVSDMHKINSYNIGKDVVGSSHNFGGMRNSHINNSSVVKLLKMMSGVFNNARASGGNITQGTPYLVGERGPEVFIPNSGGHVLSNNSSLQERSVNVVMNINGGDVSGFQKSRNQIISELASAIQRAKNV